MPNDSRFNYRVHAVSRFNTCKMCIRTIYHNFYADGERDITERVDSCAQGYLCASPRLREVERHMKYPKLPFNPGRQSSSSPAERRLSPTYLADGRPVTPRSISPQGSRGSDADRAPGRSQVYVNGRRVVDVRQQQRQDRSPRRRESWAVVVEPQRPVPQAAPEPPAPRPIPIKRSSTMPHGLDTPPPERGRRPIIVEEPAPRQPVAAAARGAPVEILEHASAPRLHRRPSARRPDNAFLTPHYVPRSGSPQGYGSAEDDRERRELRRRRREARAREAVLATSAPAFGLRDLPFAAAATSSFASTSSNGSSNRSSYASSPTISASPARPAATRLAAESPAVATVKKELRWEDQLRRKQNAIIQSRPKLERSATAAASATTPAATADAAAAGNAPLQGRVRSILKKQSSIPDGKLASCTAPCRAWTYKAAMPRPPPRAGLASPTSIPTRPPFMHRMRSRLTMPPRRYTAGTGLQRRTEIWYPDEGYYKFL